VHHVAFRVDDDSAQLKWRGTLAGLGYNVSPVMDRSYFHSIYYREPGGILFEIATHNPGFAVDETPEALGSALKLPAQFEPHRREIEAALPPLGSSTVKA
jgi:glyoxalase family protein